MPIPNAIKNLAHVCLGDDLEKTPLEGSQLSITLSFLQDFLAWAQSPEKKQGLDALISDMLAESFVHTTKPLSTVLDKLNEIHTINNEIKSLARQLETSSLNQVEKKSETDLIPLAQSIATRAQNEVFFPGGWRGSSGHQMIYQLTQQESGQYLFQAYNTGAGLNYHDYTVDASGKEKYYPVYGVCITADQKNLEKWIIDILKPQLLPLINRFHFVYSEENVYKNFTSSPHWITLSQISGRDLAHPIQTQRSGTCVFKSIEQVLRTHFDDHLYSRASFRLFLFAYRLYLFQKAMHDFAEMQKTVPGYRKLLKRAFANIVRMLDTDLSTDQHHWNLEQTQLQGIFTDWKKILQKKSDKTMHIVAINNSSENSSTDLKPVFKYPFQYQPDPNNIPQNPLPYWAPEDLSFYDALMRCVELVKSSSVTNEHCGALIERFCFAFSNDEPLLNEAARQHPDDIFNSLTTLTEFYQKYRPRLTPRSIIIHLSLMSLMDRVCEEKLFVFRGKTLSCAPLFCVDMTQFIEKLTNNPFLSTEDATLDLLLLRIKALYTGFSEKYSPSLLEFIKQALFDSESYTPGRLASYNRISTLLNYYCEIVAHSTTQEIDIIRSEWAAMQGNTKLVRDVGNLFSKGTEYCYAYLSKTGKHANTPILEQGFKRQQDLESFFVHGLQTLAVVVSLRQKENIEHRLIELTYNSMTENIYLYGTLFSKTWQNKAELLLTPIFLHDHFSFQHKHIENVLTSAYDDNAFDAQEIPFHLQDTAFSDTKLLTVERRRDAKTYSPLTFVSRQDRFTAKLHHLRRSADCQVMALLSELQHSPELLMTQDGRQYIMLTIFQPGALRSVLSRDVDLWSLINTLHAQYRLTDAPDYPEQTEWFVLKMAAAISHYALSLQQLETRYVVDEAHAWQTKILDVINIRLSKKETKITEKTELYYLKLTALHHHQTAESLPDMLTAYLTLALLPKMASLIEDKIQALLEKSLGCFKLHHQHPQMSQWILQSLASIDPTNANRYAKARMNFSFPVLQLVLSRQETIRVDLAERCITKNGNTMTYLPLCFLDSAEYRDELKSQPVLTIKTEALLGNHACTAYTWTQNNQSWRLLDVKQGQHVFWQKEMGGIWHTLAVPSEAMARSLHYSQYAFENPLPLFDQAMFRVWIVDASRYVVINHITQEKMYKKRDNTLYVYQQGRNIGILNGAIPDVLLRLEGKEFIEPIQNSGKTWRLPRYGMTVIQDWRNRLCTQDGEYFLVCPEIKDDVFDTGLMLVSQRNPQDQRLVIPFQPFYTKDYSNGIYYLSVHDFSNDLATKGGNNGKGWDYFHSESLVTIPAAVLENPHLAADRLSSEDQIYLAYLYLQQDRPNIAFQILNACQYQGSHEEIKRLWWILEKSRPSTSSRVTAVNTLVIAIIIRLLDASPALCMVPKPGSTIPSNTQRHAEREAGKLQQFIDGRFKWASSLYTDYDNRRNNIPRAMRLSITQEKLLLSAYFAHAKSKHDLENSKQFFLLQTNFEYKGILGTRYLELFPESEPIKNRIVYYSNDVTFYPKPRPAPQMTLSLPEKIMTLNPLVFSPRLATLYADLQHIEQAYEMEKKAIVEAVEALKNRPWQTQTQQFRQLDEQLLLAYRKKQAAQDQCCLPWRKTKNQAGDLKELLAGKLALEQEKSNLESTLHSILNRRVPNLIAEYGKQQDVPRLETLIKHNLECQVRDYDAMGIAKPDQTLLRATINQYISVTTAQRHLDLIIDTVKNNPHAMRSALLLQNKVNHPQEALFQYIQNITLRPEQISILSRLIAANQTSEAISYAVELVMGGGKSKVILPLLGQFLANNQQLLIVIVPPSLLDIDYKDLRKTSFTTFGQEVFLFRFDRNMPSDPNALRKHLELFETAFMHHAYIVTTPTSIQSLELKFLELSSSPKDQTEALDCLQKILTRLRNSTAIIDEAHSLLHIRKELNYAIGDKRRIAYHLVETSVFLDAFLEKAPAFQGMTFKALLAKPQEILADSTINQLMQHYVEALCQEPLTSWVADLQISPFTRHEFKAFLLSNTTDQEEERIYQVLDAYPLIKSKWILLREEFSHLLPLTLRKKLRENYGPSIDNTPFAIPYRANNTPTECVFGNFMETINYTIQMHYSEGIPYIFFKALLQSWKNEAQLERKENKSFESSAEKRFRQIFPAKKHMSLLTLDFEQDEQLIQLHAAHRHNTVLIQHMLTWCLSQLMIDSKILNSDALNLVDMFQQVYLFSASADNHHTFHDRINMMVDRRLLIASQMIDVMKRKNTELKTMNNTNARTFLSRVLDNRKPVNALIDCASWLRGYKNLDVAILLAALCVEKRKPIRYIVFYQDDVVYAMNVHDTKAPKKLTSNLCSPEEWFVYYDEEHTLGADIENAPGALALVTADVDTEISAFLQACGRMRGFLERSQTLMIALTPKLAAATKSSLDQLLNVLRTNEEKRLETDHFKAAFKKIHNVFRNDLLIRLLNKTSTERGAFFTQAQHFFIKSHSDDMSILYQEKARHMRLDDILKHDIDREHAQWLSIVSHEISQAELIAIQQLIDAIVQKSHLICLPVQWHQPNQQDSLEVQQEQQAEVEKEKQTLMASESEKIRPNKLFFDWIYILKSYQCLYLPHSFWPLWFNPSFSSLLDQYKLTFTADRNLYASTNFLYTWLYQRRGTIQDILINGYGPPDIYNFYTKPGLALLFEINFGNLSATLICMDEAQELQKTWANETRFWLSMFDGTSLTHQPELTESQTKTMHLLLEQAAFFTGRVDILLSSNLTWMRHDHVNKVQFLKEILQPCTDITDEQLEALDRKLSTIQQQDINRVERVLTWLLSNQLLNKANTHLLQQQPELIDLAVNILNFRDIALQKNKDYAAPVHAFCMDGMGILLKGMTRSTHMELKQAADLYFKQSIAIWAFGLVIDISILYLTRGIGTLAMGSIRRSNNQSFFFFNQPGECRILCEKMVLVPELNLQSDKRLSGATD